MLTHGVGSGTAIEPKGERGRVGIGACFEEPEKHVSFFVEVHIARV